MKVRKLSDLKGKALDQEKASKVIGGNGIIIGDVAVI